MWKNPQRLRFDNKNSSVWASNTGCHTTQRKCLAKVVWVNHDFLVFREKSTWMHKTMDSGINLLNYQFWLVCRISSNSTNPKVEVWKGLFRWFSCSFQTSSCWCCSLSHFCEEKWEEEMRDLCREAKAGRRALNFRPFRSSHLGFWIWGFGFWILDFGVLLGFWFWSLDVRLGFGFGIWDFLILEFGFRSLEFWIWDSGFGYGKYKSKNEKKMCQPQQCGPHRNAQYHRNVAGTIFSFLDLGIFRFGILVTAVTVVRAAAVPKGERDA